MIMSSFLSRSHIILCAPAMIVCDRESCRTLASFLHLSCVFWSCSCVFFRESWDSYFILVQDSLTYLTSTVIAKILRLCTYLCKILWHDLVSSLFQNQAWFLYECRYDSCQHHGMNQDRSCYLSCQDHGRYIFLLGYAFVLSFLPMQ